MKTNILIGSHGVGKTTLLREVKKKFPHIYTSDGFSRPVKSTSIDLTEQNKQILINELTYWRWKEDKGKSCFFTRSIIDTIIYTKTLYPNLSLNGYLESFNQYKDDYRFFYIPIEFELEEDGFRSGDKDFQIEIDNSIKLFLEENNVPYFTLSGSIEQRLLKLTQILLK